MMKLQTLTLGCSKNKVDTEHILSQVESLYEVIPEGEDVSVDVLLINTCGFIGDAKEESVQAILEAVERKNRGEVGKVIVFGCLSQRYASELPDLIPEVDGWFGAREFEPVVRALGCEPSSDIVTGRYLTTPSHYAYLKISEGCDNHCTYCAIPKIRGHFRSRKTEDIIAEAKQLAEDGVKELILIAQDTTRYGKDIGTSLANLLDELAEILPDESIADGVSDEDIGTLISDFLQNEKEDIRNVFIRKYFFFDSIGDISRRYDFTESKVKNMLYHTRIKLKDFLIKEGIEL